MAIQPTHYPNASSLTFRKASNTNFHKNFSRNFSSCTNLSLELFYLTSAHPVIKLAYCEQPLLILAAFFPSGLNIPMNSWHRKPAFWANSFFRGFLTTYRKSSSNQLLFNVSCIVCKCIDLILFQPSTKKRWGRIIISKDFCERYKDVKNLTR